MSIVCGTGEDDVAEPLAAVAERRLAHRVDLLARTGCTVETHIEMSTPDVRPPL